MCANSVIVYSTCECILNTHEGWAHCTCHNKETVRSWWACARMQYVVHNTPWTQDGHRRRLGTLLLPHTAILTPWQRPACRSSEGQSRTARRLLFASHPRHQPRLGCTAFPSTPSNVFYTSSFSCTRPTPFGL